MARTPGSAQGRRDVPPPRTGTGEKQVLTGFLDYLRESVASKLDGAAEPEVRTAMVASGTNLLGLVTHLTNVERFTDWPRTFHAPAEASVAEVVAGNRTAVAEANEVIAACRDLTEPIVTVPGPRSAPSMRWALTHMIEETGRHAGHADILRELIDGSTGR
jgi:hypothetical protein